MTKKEKFEFELNRANNWLKKNEYLTNERGVFWYKSESENHLVNLGCVLMEYSEDSHKILKRASKEKDQRIKELEEVLEEACRQLLYDKPNTSTALHDKYLKQ